MQLLFDAAAGWFASGVGFVEGGNSALQFMVQLPPHVGAGRFSTLDMKRHREARAEMLFGLDP